MQNDITEETVDLDDLCERALKEIISYLSKKDYTNAEILIDQYLKVRHDWKIHQYAAMTKMYLKKFKEAKNHCLHNIKNYNFAEDFNNLSLIEKALKNKRLSYKYAKKAYDLKSNSHAIVANYAVACKMKNKNKKAIKLVDDAISIDPKNLLYNFNKAAMLAECGKLTAAKIQFEKTLQINPIDITTHLDFFYLLMNMKKYKDAWHHYEFRYQKSGQLQDLIKKIGLPVMQIKKKYYDEEICIIPEQGLGDNLMFLRFVQDFQKVAPNSYYMAPKQIYEFAEKIGIKVHTECKKSSSHIVSIMSIPYHLSTIKIPAPICPYTHKSNISQKLKVGLCWAGSPFHPMDNTRSTYLRWYEDFLADPEMEIYSFQKDRRPRQYENDKIIYDYSEGFDNYKIIDMSPKLNDVISTIDSFNSIDLFISVDTFPIHIAGLCKIPSYVIVGDHPDWRWGKKLKTSDWYQDIKIVRKHNNSSYKKTINSLYKKIKSKHKPALNF
jgi:tetratricopeptide (TPR) repeat protein